MTERAWLDEGEVSRAWAPPAGAPVRPSRAGRILAYAGVPLALALVLGLVYAAGGFGRRTDLLEPVAPGQLIRTGLFELSFTEATARPQQDSNGVVTSWDVVAIGRARTTGEETLAPTIYGGDSMFALRDPAAVGGIGPNGARIGDDLGFSIRDRRFLAPGLPATAYAVSFPLPPDYRPGPTVILGVAKLAYETKWLVSDERDWDNTAYGFRVDLPLRVLPPEP